MKTINTAVQNYSLASVLINQTRQSLLKLNTSVAQAFLVLLLLCSASLTQAETETQKSTSIGVGTYAIAATFSNPDAKDMEFSGNSLFISHATSDSGAIRLGFFQAEDPDYYTETRGLDLQFLIGLNLRNEGFKMFFGPGYFSETVEETFTGDSYSGDISGFQLVGGIGFNTGNISIDLSVTVRDSIAYNDFMSDITNGAVVDTFADVVSASLVLSARF